MKNTRCDVKDESYISTGFFVLYFAGKRRWKSKALGKHSKTKVRYLPFGKHKIIYAVNSEMLLCSAK